MGQLITTEFKPSKAARTRENLMEAGLIDLVEIREGDAVETLASNLPETFDLVLSDGAKGLCPDVLKRVEACLRAASLVLADDARHLIAFCKRFVEGAWEPAPKHLHLAFRDPGRFLPNGH